MAAGLAITWNLSSATAYGIHGLTLAQEFLRHHHHLVLTQAPRNLHLPPLWQPRLAPYLAMGEKIAEMLAAAPYEQLKLDHAVFHAAGNNLLGFPQQFQVRGSPNVAGAALELADYTADGLDRLRLYDKIICYSHYTAELLRAMPHCPPCEVIWQGVDCDLFRPLPSSGLYRHRFVIFSGGKFEYRKGQDIVLLAFQRFAARHPEALLVTARQNLLPHQYPLAPHSQLHSLPIQKSDGYILFDEWFQQLGLQPHQFINLPLLPQHQMPSVLADCHAAVFPNRAEGGTNFVAMECLAAGVPTVVSNVAGQRDLVARFAVPHFGAPTSCVLPAHAAGAAAWGETTVEAVETALEQIFSDYQNAKAAALERALAMRAWHWPTQNRLMLQSLGCLAQ